MHAEGLPLIGVIADDVTGALASAVRLRERGLATVVEPEPTPYTSRAAQAVVVNLATRERHAAPHTLSLAERGRRAENAAHRLRDLGCRRFELRVDENLRGSPAAELGGVIRGAGFEDPCVVAVPAHPRSGRITRDGRQICFYPATIADDETQIAPRLFPSKTPLLVGLEALRGDPETLISQLRESVESGQRHIIIDAAQEEDLSRAAQTVASLSTSIDVVTVSSGAWLRYHPVLREAPREFLLVAIGTATDVHDVQYEHLLRHPGIRVLSGEDMLNMVTTRSLTEEVFATNDVLVVASETRTVNDAERLAAAADVAGHVETLLALSRMQGFICRGVLATGAYTAEAVARELGADRIEPVEEPLPLCPVGTLSGGEWTGLRVALKGGLTGTDSALSDLIDHLQAHTRGHAPRAEIEAD